MAILSLIAALLPALASAAEEDVRLDFSGNNQMYLWISLAFGVIALIAAFALAKGVLASSPGSENMQSVGLAIKEGAMAYLRQQIMTMLIFVVILAVGLFFLKGGVGVSIAFIAGVAASYIAGYAGMVMAVNGNMRTAHAALTSYKKTLEIAFRSGAVAGMVTVGMGLIGASIILWVGGANSMTLLVGFGFGGSLAALFMRVGGGIFTKAADVGADLVGKVEAGIPEDDPRNPATIADNVGDNVGDCAGMAADVFESYEVTLVAAIVLGAATAAIFDQQTWMKLILFALMARGIGILASIIGIYSVKGSDDVDKDPLKAIRKGFYASAAIALLATGGLAYYMMGRPDSKIMTTRLVTTDDYQLRQIDMVTKGRAKLAAEKKIPSWQVSAKDLAALPELAEIGANLPVSPTATADQNRVQTIFQYLQTSNQLTDENRPKPLSGYSPLTLEGNNPALDFSISTIPQSQVEEKALTSAQTPKFIKVRDALKNNQLDLAYVSVEQPNPMGGSTTPETFHYIYNKKYAEDLKAKPATGSNVKVTAIEPATLMADNTGKLAIAVNASSKDLGTIRGGQLQQVVEADPDYIDKLIKSRNPSDPNSVGLMGYPNFSVVKTAAVEHAEVAWWLFFLAIAFGIAMAFAIEMLTDYYVSTHKRPTQEVAGVSSAGPAPMIIQGFAYAAESSVFMVLSIVIALLFPLYLFSPSTYGTYILSFYGIALVGLGLLTTTGYVLAMDTFGPISDNAQGVYEMSGDGHDNEYGQKAVGRLDAAGNTTKALTKGFAIATAVVAAVALFHSYLESARLETIGLRLDIPEIFLGLMIGGAAPYLFSAFSINAVGRAAFQLINEVRRQFKADPGIMAGTSKPDYGACVAIVTAAAQKELLGPGILAIFLPIAVAFGFSIGKAPTIINGQSYNLVGAQALGGFLAGAIVSGQLMAVLLANSGGMWDNAKKIIEDGLYGGKGSEAHKAGVVCDTVGDPFKDTAGPALNPLIKVMNLVALLLASVIIRPFSDGVLGAITAVAVLLLIVSIYFSKRGSLSTEMMKATEMAHSQAEMPVAKSIEQDHQQSGAPSTTPKKRILVDEDDGKES